MDEFKKFLSARILDIENQIGQLPDNHEHREKVGDLRSDVDFYQVAVYVLQDFEDERAHARLQQSRHLSASLDRGAFHG